MYVGQSSRLVNVPSVSSRTPAFVADLYFENSVNRGSLALRNNPWVEAQVCRADRRGDRDCFRADLRVRPSSAERSMSVSASRREAHRVNPFEITRRTAGRVRGVAEAGRPESRSVVEPGSARSCESLGVLSSNASGLKTWLETGELLTTPGSLMYATPRASEKAR
jgi:hypothetical protein